MTTEFTIVTSDRSSFSLTCELLYSIKLLIRSEVEVFLYCTRTTDYEQFVLNKLFPFTRCMSYKRFSRIPERDNLICLESFRHVRQDAPVYWIGQDVVLQKDLQGLWQGAEHIGTFGEEISPRTILYFGRGFAERKDIYDYCVESAYDLSYENVKMSLVSDVLKTVIKTFSLQIMDIKTSETSVIGFITSRGDNFLRRVHNAETYVHLSKKDIVPQKGKVFLTLTVGRDYKLLPFFMDYYHTDLGIRNYLILLNSASEPDLILVNDALKRYGTEVIKVWTEPFEEHLKHRNERTLVSTVCSPDDWVVYADVDEFQEYPDCMMSILSYCEEKGYSYLMGDLVDRLGPNGTLPVIDPNMTLDEQFPLRESVTSKLLCTLVRKVVAAKASVYVHKGHHDIYDEEHLNIVDYRILRENAAPFYVPVNHYKWDSSVLERLRNNVAKHQPGNIPGLEWKRESQLALEYLIDNGRFDLSKPPFAEPIKEPPPRKEEEPKRIIPTRNLIYYIYPVPGFMLNFNLELLQKYLSIFNGRKLIQIALDRNTLEKKDVCKLLKKYGLSNCELFFSKNDPKYGESLGFDEMLYRIYSLNWYENTFFAHTKGVSKNVLKRRETTKAALITWVQYLYTLNLSNIEDIDPVLIDTPCAGAFKVKTSLDDRVMTSPWFYAGSFFWFNNGQLFKRGDWPLLGQSRYRAEEYLGKKFIMEDAYSIGGYDLEESRIDNLYKEETYRKLGITLNMEDAKRWL